MKSVIVFVLLGILTYAGGIFLFSGVTNGIADSKAPIALDSLPADSYAVGIKADTEIYQTMGELGSTREIRKTLFGIEIGEPITEHFYMIPVGKVQKDLTDQKYMLLCASNKKDIEELEKLTISLPRPVSGGDCLKLTVIMTEMDYAQRRELQMKLMDDPRLMGIELGVPNATYADHRICPYTLYICRTDSNALPAIIAGAAMTAAGAGGIILLIVKKYREKNGY